MMKSRYYGNLGIKAPAPGTSNYYNGIVGFNWLLEYQKMTFAFLTMNRKYIGTNEIGTGKTQLAL